MEEDKRPPKTSVLRNPLNVAAEKIEETRARVYGDGRSSSLKDLLVSSQTLVYSSGTSGEIDEETARRIVETDDAGNFHDNSDDGREENEEGDAELEISESYRISSGESETSLLGLSGDEKWARKIFKKPLTLAMRDIVAKRPSDPVSYLASWLLNYRSVKERSKLQDERDRELAEERKRIQEGYLASQSKSENSVFLGSEPEIFGEDEQIADSNFQNYEIL